MVTRPLLSSVQTFRHAMTRLCRTIGDEDIFSYDPQAPPGAYLCGVSQEISDTLRELSMASSLVNAQLAAQTSMEAAQSMTRAPNSLIFRQHADIFGCASQTESADLRRRLPASEKKVAALRSQSMKASLLTPLPSLGPSPIAFVEACQSRLAKLPDPRAGEFARILLFACLDQDVRAPDWLLEQSRK